MIVYFIQIGLSIVQIAILESIIAAAILFFELPTGIVADTKGRKLSTIIGYSIEGAVMIAVFFFNDFYQLIPLFMLLGVGMTFSSGARDALAIDNTKQKKYRKEYYIKTHSITAVGMILAGLLSSITIKQYGLGSIWIITGSAYFLSVIPLAFINEKEYTKNKRITIKKQTKKAFNVITKHKTIKYLLLSSFILTLALNFGNQLAFIPLLKELNFNLENLGYLWSALFAIGAVSPLLINQLSKKVSDNFFIQITLAGLAAILIAVYFVKTWAILIIILLLHKFLFSLSMPVREHYLQEFTSSNVRASIGSFRQLTATIAVMIILPIVGLTIDLYGPKIAMMISGILILPAILLYWKIRNH